MAESKRCDSASRRANKISGGKVFSSQTLRSATGRPHGFFWLRSVGCTETALEFFIAAWPDVFVKAEAVTVTARKIAVLFYKYTSSRPACARAPMDAVLRAQRRRAPMEHYVCRSILRRWTRSQSFAIVKLLGQRMRYIDLILGLGWRIGLSLWRKLIGPWIWTCVEKRLNHGLCEDAPRRNDCHRPTARH
jgi:hypothetical protein